MVTAEPACQTCPSGKNAQVFHSPRRQNLSAVKAMLQQKMAQ
ncbi:MAG: hypothetical protein NZT92_03070 [Abditibacteriales bacterium]|nr:hypothetical protein [Abditibacteriales bacterium]